MCRESVHFIFDPRRISSRLISTRPVGFFLSPRLRVGLHFTDRQLRWLEILVVDLEQAIIDNKLDEWLETVYAAWFTRWPENPYKIYCDEEEKDDIAQRRQVHNDS